MTGKKIKRGGAKPPRFTFKMQQLSICYPLTTGAWYPVPDTCPYVQTTTPVALEHVFADSKWVAVAVQLRGGPAAAIATIVTFCDGLKP